MELLLGLLIFSGFVVFDTQVIITKHAYGDHDYLSHALDLFIDFAALFRRIVVLLAQNKVWSCSNTYPIFLWYLESLLHINWTLLVLSNLYYVMLNIIILASSCYSISTSLSCLILENQSRSIQRRFNRCCLVCQLVLLTLFPSYKPIINIIIKNRADHRQNAKRNGAEHLIIKQVQTLIEKLQDKLNVLIAVQQISEHC